MMYDLEKDYCTLRISATRVIHYPRNQVDLLYSFLGAELWEQAKEYNGHAPYRQHSCSVEKGDTIVLYDLVTETKSRKYKFGKSHAFDTMEECEAYKAQYHANRATIHYRNEMIERIAKLPTRNLEQIIALIEKHGY